MKRKKNKLKTIKKEIKKYLKELKGIKITAELILA